MAHKLDQRNRIGNTTEADGDVYRLEPHETEAEWREREIDTLRDQIYDLQKAQARLEDQCSEAKAQAEGWEIRFDKVLDRLLPQPESEPLHGF